MSVRFLFPFLISAHFLVAQSFTEVPHFNSFEGVVGGATAIIDVNGDTYPDLLVTGEKKGNKRSSKLYINDGAGRFSEMATPPFPGVAFGAMALADVNGDSHPDVLLSGRIGSNMPSSRLYMNNGSGHFTKVTDTPFVGVSKGAIAVADVNGDLHPDVLLIGNSSNNRIAKLYTNDGLGNFKEVIDTPFERVDNGAIAIADLNSDQHPDIVITGNKGERTFISKLYLNNGSGQFTELTGTPFVAVFLSAIAIADVNGDEHADLLITGVDERFGTSTKLYINDGSGHFTESLGTPFEDANYRSIALSDVNGDKSPDILLAGANSGRAEIIKLYTNDGFGHFKEMTDHPFVNVAYGSFAMADVNGDQLSDVLITGKNSGSPIMKLYTNNGKGHFSDMMEIPFEGVHYGSVVLSDMNGDKHPDLLMTGRIGQDRRFYPRTLLYTNDGKGHFTEVVDTPFENVGHGAIAIADVNGDDYPDALITGKNRSGDPITKLYTNDGAGRFSEIADTPFAGVYHSSIALADVNGDHHPDALITGQNSAGSLITKLYTNNGSGHFSEVVATPFEGVEHGAIALADVNGDDYPDALISGRNSSGDPITKLYTNNGSGHFSEVIATPFEGVEYSAIAIADLNDDDHPDVLISGQNSSRDPITKHYTNNESGHFSAVTDSPFEGVYAGDIAIADMNGDHHPDILISGKKKWKTYSSKLYINSGFGGFTEVTGAPFKGLGWGSVVIADVNGDHRPDILLAGYNDAVGITRLYIQARE